MTSNSLIRSTVYLIVGIAALTFFSSCSAPLGLDISGHVAYVFDDGSKARIVSDGKTHSAEYWRKVGDSWVRLETDIKPAEVTVEK